MRNSFDCEITRIEEKMVAGAEPVPMQYCYVVKSYKQCSFASHFGEISQNQQSCSNLYLLWFCPHNRQPSQTTNTVRFSLLKGIVLLNL